MDSSGLKVYGECEWKVREHGWGKRRTWRKIHLGVDEKSGEITAQVLTDNKTDDAGVLVDLVVNTFEEGVDINKVGTDGACDHYDCWDMLIEAEIEPIIPPGENAVFQVDEDGMLTDHPRNRALEIIDEGGWEANRKGGEGTIRLSAQKQKRKCLLAMEDNIGRKNVCREFATPKNRGPY